MKFDDRINIITPGLKNIDHYTYSTSRTNLLSLMNESHIVIDQMLIGWYGLKAVEALALDCKVICYIEEDLKDYLPENCPIIQANVLNLEKILEETIINFNFEEKIDNRLYIKNNHSIEIYKSFFKSLWSN